VGSWPSQLRLNFALPAGIYSYSYSAGVDRRDFGTRIGRAEAVVCSACATRRVAMSKTMAGKPNSRTQAPSATPKGPLPPTREAETPETDEHSDVSPGFLWLSRKQVDWLPLLVPLGALALALGAAAILTTA
jgi:hypothetical protein